MKKMLPQIIIGVLVVSAVAFYGGVKYSESKTVVTNGGGSGQGQQRGGGQFGGARMGGNRSGGNSGGFANGEVASIDDKSLTIKMRDGSSKIIILSTSIQVLKSATGTLSDVVTGTEVVVNGSPNSDGSITAQSIQIRPNMPNSTTTNR